ncbi:MAG: DUF6531 domain-containing protein, partial [Actinomycetota bacterium]|nr:DUF6531 domain-containing protein [Actinomycetota bacterium]
MVRAAMFAGRAEWTVRRSTAAVVVVATLVSSLLVGVLGSTPVGADPSLAPAWAAGAVGFLGNGRTTGSIFVTNTTNSGWAEPTTVPVAVLSDVQVVAAGWYHTLAVKGDGTVWAWGSDGYGETGPARSYNWPAPVGLSGVATVAAGSLTSLALKTDGTVWAWGSNGNGNLGNGSGPDSNVHTTPTRVSLTGVFTAIATNGEHSLALRSDGTLWAWGYNQYGQVGNGSTHTTYVTTPTQVKNLTGIVSIAAGFRHSLAVRNDGTVWAWGQNGYYGELGDGTTTDRSTPVQVVGLSNGTQVAGGETNSVALDSSGHVWTWGEGGHGESGLNPPVPGYPPNSSLTPVMVPSLSNVTKIAKKDRSTLAVKSDGTVWAWGENSFGQLGINDVSYCVYPNYGQPIRCTDLPTQVIGMSSPRSIDIGAEVLVASNGGSITPHGYLAGETLNRPVSEMLGNWQGQASLADPVDTASGNFVHDEADLDAPSGAFGLAWERTYNSRSTATGPLGPGWSTSFSDHITVDGNGNAVLTQADGRSVRFVAAGGGAYTRPSDEFANLTQLGDNTFRLALFDGETWAFDASGRLTLKTNWDAVTATPTYGQDGALTRIDNSAGPSLTFTEASGLLTDVTTSDGRHVTYTYTNGALASATTPRSGTTTYGLDTHGFVSSVTDAMGANVATNTYDSAGRVLTQTTGAAGSPTTFSYDDTSGTTRATDGATGQSLTYTHDAAGRVRAVFDSVGGIESNTYNTTTGYLTASVNRLGGGESRTYDPNGNVTGVTNANGVTRTATYDANNRPLTISDPATGTKTFTYTGNDRLPTTVTADAKTTTFTITNGLVTQQTDPDGVVTTFAYDTNRRLVTATLAFGTPLAATTTYTYDSAGHVLTATDALNHTTTFTYATGGQVASKTDALNDATTYSYDNAGHLLTTTDPTNAVTTNTYDTSGRLATTRTPRGLVTTSSYDSLGELITTTRPDGTSTTHKTYAPLGRVASTSDELNRSTAYTYNLDGNVTAVTDPTNAVTSTTFDVGGRQTSTIDARARTSSTTTYDTAGRVASTTTLGGITTAYGYDGLGRVTSVTDSRGGVTAT